MTTNHPISIRILSLFTIIILLFGLVGCNSNDNKGQNGGESTNKEQETTYTADYKWWEENANFYNSRSSVSYFESNPTEMSDTRYLAVFAGKGVNDDTEIVFVFTEKNSNAYRELKVDMSTAKYIDYAEYEGGYYKDSFAYGWSYKFISPLDEDIDIEYRICTDGTKHIFITSLDELLGVELPIICTGTYIPTKNPPEESSTPSTDNNTSNNTEIDVDFNVNVDERI